MSEQHIKDANVVKVSICLHAKSEKASSQLFENLNHTTTVSCTSTSKAIMRTNLN